MVAMTRQPRPERIPKSHKSAGLPRADFKVISEQATTMAMDMKSVNLCAKSNQKIAHDEIASVETRLQSESLTMESDGRATVSKQVRVRKASEEMERWRTAMMTVLEKVCAEKHEKYDNYYNKPVVAFVSGTMGGISNTARSDVLRMCRWAVSQCGAMQSCPEWLAEEIAARLWKKNSFAVVRAWYKSIQTGKEGLVLRRDAGK